MKARLTLSLLTLHMNPQVSQKGKLLYLLVCLYRKYNKYKGQFTKLNHKQLFTAQCGLLLRMTKARLANVSETCSWSENCTSVRHFSFSPWTSSVKWFQKGSGEFDLTFPSFDLILRWLLISWDLTIFLFFRERRKMVGNVCYVPFFISCASCCPADTWCWWSAARFGASRVSFCHLSCSLIPLQLLTLHMGWEIHEFSNETISRILF